MTPLSLLVAARLRYRTRLEVQRRHRCVLARRPRGVLHAYVGPLTPSGRFTPRAARPACGTPARGLGVVPLSEVRRQRVCVRCTALLTRGSPTVGGEGNQTRAELLAAYDGVTAYDLAVDAWRAESADDVARVEWLALLLVGYPATATDPVVSPDGKNTGPLGEHLAKARRRLGITRDVLGPEARAAADENELVARHNAKAHRRAAWQDREDRIARLGYGLATSRPRTA